MKYKSFVVGDNGGGSGTKFKKNNFISTWNHV